MSSCIESLERIGRVLSRVRQQGRYGGPAKERPVLAEKTKTR